MNPYRLPAEQPYYAPEAIIATPTYAGYSNAALIALGKYWSDYFHDVQNLKCPKPTENKEGNSIALAGD